MINDINIFKKLIDPKKDVMILSDNLKDNDSFCMAPWVHLNISPNGDVPICCNAINTKDTILGNVNNNSLEEIWNSDQIKQIRLKMLKGEKIKECSSCYDREKISQFSSMRKSFNYKYFDKYKKIVNKTELDGSVKDFNIVYFDFRFSNKCNFSCRTCGPHYSSSWEKKLNIINPKIKDTSKIIEKTKQMIIDNKLEEIYFAGGETLITDEHWEIINFLIEHKKFNIMIRYNTNLSVLKYKKNDFVEKLKLFNNVTVSPSCDSLGIKGEYIRTGFSSKNFIKNINTLKENNFNYYITSVLSFFNIIYLYDFFKDLKDNDISFNDIHFIILTNTDLYSVYNLPENVLEKSLDGINKLIDSNFISMDKKNMLNNLKNSLILKNKFNLNNFKKRMSYIKKQDEINKLKFEDCFPELLELIKDYL